MKNPIVLRQAAHKARHLFALLSRRQRKSETARRASSFNQVDQEKDLVHRLREAGLL